MSDGLFIVRFVTPLKSYEREVRSLRLWDRSGSFGIMKGHSDFMTTLIPSLGVYRDQNDREIYLAVNGGLLLAASHKVTLLSRDIMESGDADRLGSLFKEEIDRGGKYERTFGDMMRGVEKAFWEKRAKVER